MKISVDFNLDWIEEERDLDEAIQSRIISEVVKKVSEKINETAIEKISLKVNEILDEKIKTMFDDFMDKTFDVCDQWGDVKQKGVNVKNLLKEKLDKLLTEKVDQNGNPTQYNGTSRYLQILDQQSKKQIDEFITNISKNVIQGVKADINEEAQKKITKAILGDYDLKKLIS